MPNRMLRNSLLGLSVQSVVPPISVKSLQENAWYQWGCWDCSVRRLARALSVTLVDIHGDSL